MKKLLFAISLSLLAMAFNEAKAQVGEFAYQVSFPTGDFKNFVSKPSWVGFSGQYRWLLNNKRVSVGGSLNWYYFADKQGTKTVDLGDDKGTYHGFVTNFTNIYSLLGVVQYDLKDPHEKLVPFIRVGAGIAYQDQRKDVGIYEFKADGAQFAWNAELGVRTMRHGSGVLLALTYHGLPKSGDMIATSYVGIKLGFTRYPF